MANLNELRAERADIFAAAEQLVQRAKADKKDLGGAALAQYNGLLTTLNALDKQIEGLSQHGATSHFPTVPASHPTMMARDTNGNALPIFAKGQSVAAHLRQESGSPEDGEVSLGALIRGMTLGGGSPAVRAALSIGTDSAGGVTVPVVLSGQLIDALRARSVMFQAGASTMILDTGKSTTIAAITGDPTATWRAEAASVATSDMTFAPVTLTPKTLAVLVTASRELVEDSTNLDEALHISLSAAFSQELDRVALLGSGTGSEPKGVSKTSGVGSVIMAANGAPLSAYDPFVQALGILRGANAFDPTALIINPRSDQELNLLKDTLGQPLRRPQALENLPFLVTSKLPITETQGSSNTASRAVMGYFPDVLVGIRSELRIELLREKFADTLQYGFLAYLRADIAVRHAANFCNVIGIN